MVDGMPLILTALAMLITGQILMLGAVVVAVRVVANSRDGRSILTGTRPQMDQDPLPFVIKDDAKEHQIELENLGYKPLDRFDNVEGLGR